MASAATGEKEEDRVACPVCFIPYRKPQSLKCGHVLCTPCINTMFERNQDDLIQCTICRRVSEKRDLRRDFTMEDFVERYLEKQKQISVPIVKPKTHVSRPLKPCEVCESSEFTHKCFECEQFLCADCKRSHLKIRATKGHTVQDLATVKQPIVQELKVCIQHYEKMRDELDKKLNDVEKHNGNIAQNSQNVIAEIREFEKEFGQAVKNKCDNLCTEANSLADKEVAKQGNLVQVLSETKADMTSQIKLLNEITRENDTTTLLAPGFLHDVEAHRKQKQGKAERALQLGNQINKTGLKLMFAKPGGWEKFTEDLLVSVSGLSRSVEKLPHHAITSKPRNIEITSGGFVNNKNWDQTDESGSLMSVTTRQLDKKTSQIVMDCNISLIQGQIWIYGSDLQNRIHIYDSKGHKLREISVDIGARNSFRKIVQVRQGAVVANLRNFYQRVAECVQINPNKQCIVTCIASTDTFSGTIKCDRDTIYVCDQTDSRLHVSPYTFHDGICKKGETFAITKPKKAVFRAVSNSLFYFKTENSVIAYNEQGKVVFEHRLPSSSGHREWIIRDSDERGNLLLEEYDALSEDETKTHQLVVMNKEGEMRKVTCPNLRYVWGVVVDTSGSLWIIDKRDKQYFLECYK